MRSERSCGRWRNNTTIDRTGGLAQRLVAGRGLTHNQDGRAVQGDDGVGVAVTLTIRLPKAEWAKAWRAMIEIAPVRLIAPDPVYEVLPAHLASLNSHGITYSV